MTRYPIIDHDFPSIVIPGQTISGKFIQVPINNLLHGYIISQKNYNPDSITFPDNTTYTPFTCTEPSPGMYMLSDITIPYNLPPGDYFLCLQNDDKLVYTYDLNCTTTINAPTSDDIPAHIHYYYSDIGSSICYLEYTENSGNTNIDTWIWYDRYKTHNTQTYGPEYPKVIIGNTYTIELFVKTTDNVWRYLTKNATPVVEDPDPYPEYQTDIDLTQWLYKRSHDITSATELTNYQVKIRVYRTEGTSTGDTVYLGSKCLADYGDIRFVASDDTTELSYWMETNAGTYADFWVKVPSINTTTIWIYYGNESASTTSSGDTTFILFDHFDGSSINSSKWTVEKKGSASAIAQVNGSSILQLSGANGVTSSANLISVATFAQPFVLEIQEQINTTNGAYANTSFGLTTTLQDSDNAGSNWWITILGNSYAFTTAGYNSNGVMFRSPLGGIYVSFGLMSGKIFPAANTYYRNRYIKTSTGIQFIRDGISYGTATDATYTGPFYICINQGEHSGGSSYAGYRYIDYILVRNYSATEPTHGEWSEEQLVASYPLYITITPTSGTEPLSVSYTLHIRNALNNFILNFGDSNTYIGDDVTSFSTTHEYNTPGTYTVWAEGYNEFATHVYYEIPYGVTVSSQVVTTSFTYDQSNNVVQFTDTSTGDVNEWYWTFGDGTHSYEQNPHHTYTSIGTYTVTLYSSNQYQYGLYSIEIPVSTITYVYPPVPNFKPACLNVITDDLPCSVQFTDLSFPTTGCTYYWTFGDTSTSTSQNPLHSYASLGVYDVSLTVTNDYGSSTITYEDCIKIHNEAKIFKENLTYNDEFSTFGIMLFIETPTYSDIFIKAKVFTDNCYYTQGEFPSDPGIDEYCNLSFYTNINEYCETLFDNVTDYLKRTVIDPVMSVLGFQKLKMKEFTETVYYDDVLSLEPPT